MTKPPLSKQQQIEATWKQAAKPKVQPVPRAIEPDRPFRAELPEWQRSKLKHSVNNRNKPLPERVESATKLGWLVERESETCFAVTTHNGQKFFIDEASPVVKGR
jgi:hypothetical protein